MPEHIKALIGSGLKVGPGLACLKPPFSEFVVLGYYDGATEGFARVAPDSLIYFRKIWWDEWQDNRLFDGLIFPVPELKAEAPELLSFFDRWSKNRDWSKPLPSSDRDHAECLKQFALRPGCSVKLYIFCKSITDEVFILPVEAE